MQKRKGFTTVELVIVIAVIAILATALIPTFGGLIKSANHNVDVQAANQLTTLVVMHSVNHTIDSESDLADAINEGMNDPNYYANLQAKSAKYGYCFWYDYADPKGARVRVGTVEEIAEIANDPARQAKTFSPDGIRLGSAGSSSGSNNWGLRAQIVDGFFLMCHKGDNDLVNLIVSLENADQDTYGKTLVELKKLPDSEEYKENETVKTAITNFVAKATETPILNENGLFTTKTEISSVYIPYDVGELASTSVNVTKIDNGTADTDSTATVTLSTDFKLELPSGTKIAADILDLERADNVDNSNPKYNGSHEIHLDIEEDELGDYFYADTTDAVIVIPSGSYIQEGNQFVKLDGTVNGTPVENVTAAAYGNLTSFGVGFVADGAATGKSYILDDLQANKTLDYDLYISADHTGSVTLTAGTFLGYFDDPSVTENLPVRSVTITLTKEGVSEEISNNGLSATLTGLSNGDLISVKARGITHTYKVKITKIDPTSFYIDSLDGDAVVKANASHDDVFELMYDSESSSSTLPSWVVKPYYELLNMLYNGDTERIDLDQSLSMVSSLGEDSLFNFNPDNNTLSLKNAMTGESAAETLTFTCNGVTTTITVKLYDNKLTAFETNPILSNMSGKGSGYVVGTQGTTTDGTSVLTLADLFQLKSNVANFDSYKLEVTNISGASISGASIDLGIDWTSYPLQSALHNNDVSGQITLHLSSYGGVAHSVTVYVACGAYNVSTLDEWKATPNGVSIALLDSFTVPAGSSVNEPEKTATPSGTGYYSKDIGANTIYGNLKTITVPNDFLIKAYTYNYFINITGGAIDRLIVLGPNYDSTIAITGDNAKNYGTYVAAVMAMGTTDSEDTVIPAKITNSFLSGFRSPVHANGGRIEISNSTLHLGNYANVYVDQVCDLNLTDVITVQYETDANGDGSGAIGGGISYKYSCNVGQKLTTTRISMYNFLTKSQVDNIINSAGTFIEEKLGYFPDITAGCGDMKAMEKLTHSTSDGIPYYHMGITAMYIAGKSDDFTGNTFTLSMNEGSVSDMVTIDKTIAKLYMWGLGDGAENYTDDVCSTYCKYLGDCKSSSGGCDHHNKCSDGSCQSLLLPVANTTNHLEDFLSKQ